METLQKALGANCVYDVWLAWFLEAFQQEPEANDAWLAWSLETLRSTLGQMMLMMRCWLDLLCRKRLEQIMLMMMYNWLSQ